MNAAHALGCLCDDCVEEPSLLDIMATPATRAQDHETSERAAAAMASVTGKIALEVLEFFKHRGLAGGTDDELKVAFPDAAESSYRKRRTELFHKGLLVDTGQTRPNRRGRDEIVWRLKYL